MAAIRPRDLLTESLHARLLERARGGAAVGTLAD